jgi:hypothetical protein
MEFWYESLKEQAHLEILGAAGRRITMSAGECGLEPSVLVSCEHGNELSGSVQC